MAVSLSIRVSDSVPTAKQDTKESLKKSFSSLRFDFSSMAVVGAPISSPAAQLQTQFLSNPILPRFRRSFSTGKSPATFSVVAMAPQKKVTNSLNHLLCLSSEIFCTFINHFIKYKSFLILKIIFRNMNKQYILVMEQRH